MRGRWQTRLWYCAAAVRCGIFHLFQNRMSLSFNCTSTTQLAYQSHTYNHNIYSLKTKHLPTGSMIISILQFLDDLKSLQTWMVRKLPLVIKLLLELIGCFLLTSSLNHTSCTLHDFAFNVYLYATVNHTQQGQSSISQWWAMVRIQQK